MKNKKILILVLVVAVIALGLYFFLHDTSTLITYSDPRLGLSFKYPSDLTIKEQEGFVFTFNEKTPDDILNKVKTYLENSSVIKPGSVTVITPAQLGESWAKSNPTQNAADFAANAGPVIEALPADSLYFDSADPDNFFGKGFSLSMPGGLNIGYHPLLLNVSDSKNNLLMQIDVNFTTFTRNQFVSNHPGFPMQQINNITWFSTVDPGYLESHSHFDIEGMGIPLRSTQGSLSPTITIQNSALTTLLPEDQSWQNSYYYGREERSINIAKTIMNSFVIGNFSNNTQSN